MKSSSRGISQCSIDELLQQRRDRLTAPLCRSRLFGGIDSDFLAVCINTYPTAWANHLNFQVLWCGIAGRKGQADIQQGIRCISQQPRNNRTIFNPFVGMKQSRSGFGTALRDLRIKQPAQEINDLRPLPTT